MPRVRLSNTMTVSALLIVGSITGCDSSPRQPPPSLGGSPNTIPSQNTGQGSGPNLDEPSDPNASSAYPGLDRIEFADKVKSNREDDDSIGDLEFVDTQGQTIRLDDYVGKKNVLLVFTRGFSGQLCPYCTTQTSRLIANYDQFTERDTEVLLVYPGQKAQLGDFKAASLKASDKDGFPFPVVLDEDLAAVNRLDIAAQLAFPSTFIIDKQGRVTLSYVGESPTDRPSIKALLAQLDSLQR